MGCAILSYAVLAAFEAAYHTRARLGAALQQQRSRVWQQLQASPGRLNLALLSFQTLFMVVYALGAWQLLALLSAAWPAQAGASVPGSLLVLVLGALGAGLVFLILAEWLPKALARAHALAVLQRLVPIAYTLWWLSGPTHRLLLFWQRRATEDRPDPLYSKHDLQRMIHSHLASRPLHQVLDAQTFANALRFNTICVSEFMVPRAEVVAVSQDASMEQLRALFLRTEFSRILVYAGSEDNVLGYVHSQSLLDPPRQLRQALRPISRVGPDTRAHELMAELNASHRSIAVVMQGQQLVGLVTVEDLVEVIFGEIADEHDDDEPPVVQVLGPGTYRLSAQLELGRMRQQLGIQLPEGPYATLGGAVCAAEPGSLRKGQVLYLADYRITIEAARHGRPVLLHLVRISSAAGAL
ncbi:MAG: CBS domain-containing protein [Bacteroidetes bacterium]|jgi:putative hemolysin|nr:CBS domain-containing protein [Bacteroidota bacterium]